MRLKKSQENSDGRNMNKEFYQNSMEIRLQSLIGQAKNNLFENLFLAIVRVIAHKLITGLNSRYLVTFKQKRIFIVKMNNWFLSQNRVSFLRNKRKCCKKIFLGNEERIKVCAHKSMTSQHREILLFQALYANYSIIVQILCILIIPV